MKGHLYANAGPKRKVVILAHGANEDQAAWQPFAQELAAKGIAAVTFDFRGFGETGGAKDPSKLAADLDVAVRFLKSQDWPLVYIVGSDIGGTAALKVAVNEDLAGVATISSLPNAGNGLDATSDIPKVVEPKLFLAGGADLAANSAVLTMNGAATEPRTSLAPQGVSLHGIALLQNDAAKQALLSFIGAP
jgi:alpha-beta hydrolase superfamily lysophospholipase